MIGINFGSIFLEWKDFDSLTKNILLHLKNRGIKKNDFLIIEMDSCLDFYIILDACFQLGIIAIPLRESISLEKLETIKNDLDCVYKVKKITKNKDLNIENIEIKNIKNCTKTYHFKVPLDEISLILYTSGTSGKPKGICISQRNIDFITSTLINLFNVTSSDKILNIIPSSFDYGLYQYFQAKNSGASIYISEGRHFLGQIIEDCIKYKVTILPLMPSILSLMKEFKLYDVEPFYNIIKITSTGENLTKNHINLINHYFPKAKIYSMYGLTECIRVSCLLPHELNDKWPSVGKPIPGVKIDIVDKNNNCLDAGHKGRLRIRGNNVSLGYLIDYDKKDCKFSVNKGIREIICNDIVSTDKDGYLYYHGRVDDLVKISGKRVSLNEVSNVAKMHSDVIEAKAELIKKKTTDKLVLKLQLHEGSPLKSEDIKQYIFKKTLETQLIPDEIEFIKSFNLTHNLKVK